MGPGSGKKAPGRLPASSWAGSPPRGCGGGSPQGRNNLKVLDRLLFKPRGGSGRHPPMGGSGYPHRGGAGGPKIGVKTLRHFEKKPAFNRIHPPTPSHPPPPPAPRGVTDREKPASVSGAVFQSVVDLRTFIPQLHPPMTRTGDRHSHRGVAVSRGVRAVGGGGAVQR